MSIKRPSVLAYVARQTHLRAVMPEQKEALRCAKKDRSHSCLLVSDRLKAHMRKCLSERKVCNDSRLADC